MDLDTLADFPLTYPEVGATAGPPPPGYKYLGFSSQIGVGQKRFQDAAAAVMHWGMQRGAGLRVRASSDVVTIGAVVMVGLGFVWAPCRVVYVIDEPDIKGFAYGTLPGHPESGEERFVVRHDPVTAAVFAEVSSFSRPAKWWSKAAGPLLTLGQRIIAKRYVHAV
ncbi:DUF1990 family protein [Mycobacterium shimoidei]|uniref:DUF1990 domain-containing protein n=1 Tax=Mycobacterium shimoidei TaxID=29313 RepID=A0A1E3TEL0_MYCSH|nr:DUF1990 domain-containing protein [Mycobacterium shimoidei]MCV7258100.1 DUF1990 domain-containing protein [Mycobacterium shimoidei]ODR12820.1 hypothetical protein BHQ16_14045 [Mycobacterium shimoidei]ORW83458.1 hypothetical protein AWC26_01630 [Mycobacterium shimoidei]SRX95659.1 hypothetical protein MSP7336_03928 [Mycobacterium shimoidei]